MNAPSKPRSSPGPKAAAALLPAVTIVIEWENAIDVEDEWTKVAIVALEREMEAVAKRSAARPRILYLYDSSEVEAGLVERMLDEAAPRLRKLADVEIVPTPGLQYYQLKNYGVAQATTDIAVLLDSDAAPQPGWLENLLEPLADPRVMVVGGFTILAYEDLLSKTMALSWFFDLADERQATLKRKTIHANNVAFRRAFFSEHPFPDLPMFKKQCEYWRKTLTAQGHKFVRSADAVTIHAPHPGFRFVLWRGWSSGRDADALAWFMGNKGRLNRVGHAFGRFGAKLLRSWKRIWTRGAAVDLPVWQRPAAMVLALCYFAAVFYGQLTSALSRSFADYRSAQAATAAA